MVVGASERGGAESVGRKVAGADMSGGVSPGSVLARSVGAVLWDTLEAREPPVTLELPYAMTRARVQRASGAGTKAAPLARIRREGGDVGWRFDVERCRNGGLWTGGARSDGGAEPEEWRPKA